MNTNFESTHSGNTVSFYYKEIEKAASFYETVLGLRRIKDVREGSLFQLSPTTYLRLERQELSIPWSTAPKSVTLSFITEEIDEWHDYLTKAGVPMHKPLANATRHPTRGFVALDPEGYFLEFETFLPDSQNEQLRYLLAQQSAIYPKDNSTSSRPTALGVQGNVFWLYYQDIPAAEQFYQQVMGLVRVTDQGFAKIYASSETGFIGLVDGAKGLHQYSATKSIVMAFITTDEAVWRSRLAEAGFMFNAQNDDLEGNGIVKDVGGYIIMFESPI